MFQLLIKYLEYSEKDSFLLQLFLLVRNKYKNLTNFYILLRNKYNTTTEENSIQMIFIYSIIYNYLEVVKELLKDPRIVLSDKNNYAIKLALFLRHKEIIKTLLKDPRVDDSDYYSQFY